MAMPKRKRRSITFENVIYHYKIPDFERTDRAVIQHSDGGSCIFLFLYGIMKPANAADAISFAISNGWEPLSEGESMWLTFEPDEEGKSYFKVIPNDDFLVVTYPHHGKVPKHLDASQFRDTRPWYKRKGPRYE